MSQEHNRVFSLVNQSTFDSLIVAILVSEIMAREKLF